MIDVGAARADTPGCAHGIHLDHAGSSLPPRPVLARVDAHLEREAEVGGYQAAAECAADLEAGRAEVAALIGATPGEVAITTSDTAAWVKAFWGLEASGWFDGGGRVLVDRAAYNSHYLSLLQARRRHGLAIEVVDATGDGSIDLDDLDRRLDASVRLVTATHVGTHRGLVNPVAAVGARTRHAGVPYFLDACQSIGQLPVDVEAIGCDVATATGRKFLRGPRGTGFLYVRPEWAERMDPPGIDGTSATWVDADRYDLLTGAARFEEFESFVAGRLGLGAAVAYARTLGVDAITQRVQATAARLRGALERAGAALHDGGRERCAIVTFTLPGGPEPQAVRTALAGRGIRVSVTTAPWARLDMEQRGLPGAVRASVHYVTTDDEVDEAAAAVAALARA